MNFSNFKYSQNKQYYFPDSIESAKAIINACQYHKDSFSTNSKTKENSGIKSELGINFLNGFLSFEKKKLFSHSFKQFQTNVFNINYNEDAILCSKPRSKFLQFINHSNNDLFLIKSVIHRCMFPNLKLQTGYYFYGPTGGGKSEFAKIVKNCCEEGKSLSLTFNELKSNFKRLSLINKNCLIINETDKIDKQGEIFLKQLLSRDRISIKHKSKEINFVFEGIIIIISNENPRDMFSNSPSLHDRFFSIQFNNPPKYIDIDPDLSDMFKENLSSILNWAMNMRKESLNKLVRVRRFNAVENMESTNIGEWLMDRVVYAPNQYYVVQEAFNNFKQYLDSRNIKDSMSQSFFSTTVSEYCRRYCNTYTLKKRKVVPRVEGTEGAQQRKVFVLTNIRLRLASNEETLESHLIKDENFDDENVWENMKFPEKDYDDLPIEKYEELIKERKTIIINKKEKKIALNDKKNLKQKK